MELTRRHALQLIGGTSLTGTAGCLDSGSSCDPACFESDYLGYDDALAVMTITHVGGKGILAQELFVSGVADEYPTAPGESCTRPWHKISEFESYDVIEEGDSIDADIGLVNAVELLWRNDGEMDQLEEFETTESQTPMGIKEGE